MFTADIFRCILVKFVVNTENAELANKRDYSKENILFSFDSCGETGSYLSTDETAL